MSPTPSVALVPYYGAGGGCHAHYESLRKSQVSVAAHGRNTVDAARCILVELVLQHTPAEVLVFIDSDISFSRADYNQIVESCAETRSVVAAPYLTKMLDGTQRMTSALLNPEPEFDFYVLGKRYPARCLSMGFTAIHRDVIARVASYHKMEKVRFGETDIVQAYPLFLPMVHEGQYVHEDYAFCIRARQAGVELFLDTRPQGIRHHGDHGYRMEDMLIRSAHQSEFCLKHDPTT